MRASSSDRVIQCPASLVLPKHILPRREKTDDANQLGTLCHHWKEVGHWSGCWPSPLTEKQDGFVRLLLKKLALSGLDDLYEEYWPSGCGRHEVTFAYSPFTLELVLYEGERWGADEWKKQSRFDASRWVTGTIDWLGHTFGKDRWRIDDLKTGAWPVAVEDNKQLLSYAVVPWLMDEHPDEWELDVSITSWPKYPLAGLPTRKTGIITAFEIQEHLQDLRWALGNPQIVRPSDYGEAQVERELANCAGCDCREPVPGISGWVTHFWFRTLPHCAPGMMAMLRKKWDDGSVQVS